MAHDELQEAREQAEHVERDRSLLPATFTISVLAVLVAIVTLLGHRSHTEELLAQSKASDTWAEYQAQNIRRHTYGAFSDLMSVSDFKNPESAKKVREKFRQQAERYEKQKDEVQAEARKLEAEVQVFQRKANHFDLGEALLEMGLVITSVSLLTKRRGFWFAGMFFGIAGLASAALALTVH